MHETTPRDRLARLRALHEAACLRAPALQALYGRAGMTPADTARRIADIRASAEGREGIQSFLGKRAPSWQG